MGMQSPTASGDSGVAAQPIRLHTPSEDGSATSDQSITAGQQSDSDDEGQDQQVPTKKRRREEKKHACPYCKKLFHRPVSLGVHINTHTGEKRKSHAHQLSSKNNWSKYPCFHIAYTCPFPNCSRQFNVNSNMRRHYRTHFTPGTIDISQLTYSAADERFYIHAIAPTTATIGRGRYGPVAPYIPPMPSTSYGIPVPSHVKSSSYSGPNSPPTANRNSPYAVLPVSYVPITYNNRSMLAVDYSSQHQQLLPRGDPHKNVYNDGRDGDHKRQEPPRSVGRLKPASDWARGGRRGEEEDEDESDSDN
jgi:Zinc finger, C2H2 type